MTCRLIGLSLPPVAASSGLACVRRLGEGRLAATKPAVRFDGLLFLIRAAT